MVCVQIFGADRSRTVSYTHLDVYKRQVKNGFAEVYNNFWIRYKNRQPKEESPEWERMHTIAAVYRKKHPVLEETINRMLTELVDVYKRQAQRIWM